MKEWRSKEPTVFRRVQVDATRARHGRAASSAAPLPATARATGQVYFLPQGSAEGGHGLGGIILTAREASLNILLDASAERLEQLGRSPT